MKKLLILIVILCFKVSSGQTVIQSGEYDDGLRLCYDSQAKKLTGYYENYTGWDEETQNPRFSCIFYIEGTVTGKKFKIKTYYPDDKTGDLITGTLEIISNSSVKISLPEEHGGCWNVTHFSDEPVLFKLQKSYPWKKISYIKSAKSYFYSNSLNGKKTKKYVVVNDFVCIEKIENGWAYCTYFGEKTTKGWIKQSDIF